MSKRNFKTHKKNNPKNILDIQKKYKQNSPKYKQSINKDLKKIKKCQKS